VTTPVVIKLDYNWSGHWVSIAQLSKTPTITYIPELDQTKRQLTCTVTVYASPLMTLTEATDLGLSIRVSMFEYV